MTKTKYKKIIDFREHMQRSYHNNQCFKSGDFGEILCYELHSQPINPRMNVKTMNYGFQTGLTFRELAKKWGISVTFLGELIADHCVKLEE